VSSLPELEVPPTPDLTIITRVFIAIMGGLMRRLVGV
jgi:hypothetical protein